MQRGSLQLILLVFLGLTAVFSVVTFASEKNPIERPLTTVVCKLRPDDIVCKNPKTTEPTTADPRTLDCIPTAQGALCPTPTPATNK